MHMRAGHLSAITWPSLLQSVAAVTACFDLVKILLHKSLLVLPTLEWFVPFLRGIRSSCV